MPYSFEAQIKNLLEWAPEVSEKSRFDIAMYAFVAIVDFIESSESESREMLQAFLQSTSFDGSVYSVRDVDDWLKEIRYNWGVDTSEDED